MALVDLVTEDVIKLPLKALTKTDVLRELTQVLADAGHVGNLELVLDALMLRESKGSTGLEAGIAVPHCKTTEVDTLVLAIGISPEGIEFDALDGQPSKLFFMMLAPPDQSGPHIEALSEIARSTQSKAFCVSMIESRTAKEVVELFRE